MGSAHGLAGTTARALLREATRRARRLLDARYALPPRVPERIIVAPPDPLPGDPALATEMYGGTFRLAEVAVETFGESPFTIENAPTVWSEALHGFGWMRHHRAAGTELAQLHVRTLLTDWIKTYGNGAGELPWRPVVAATRLRHWISHSPVVVGHSDFVFLDEFLRQLAWHHRFVKRAAVDATDPFERVRLLATLCSVSLTFPSTRQEQRRYASALASELDAQVLSDGGHVSRRAASALELAGDLLPLGQCYEALGLVTPPSVIRALDRILPMLALHRHTDGTLARHNGTRGDRADRTEAVLALSPLRGTPPAEAPQSGYQRLAIADTVVIVDTGAAPPIEHASRAHAGVASFEMSIGSGASAKPLIVNIGDVGPERVGFREAFRTLNAHSTLSVNAGSEAYEIAGKGLRAKLFGRPLIGGPTHVDVQRADAQDGSWRGFRVSHDAFARKGRSGRAMHGRTFALSRNGTVLEGRDELSPPPDVPNGWVSPGATVRFHLHPSVDAEAMPREGKVVLRPESGPEWIFEFEGGEAVLTDSLYAVNDTPEASRQIELSIPEGGLAANWTLRRND